CFAIRHFTSHPTGTGHDNITENVYIHHNGTGFANIGGSGTFCRSVGGGITMGDANNIARHNVIVNNGGNGIYFLYNAPNTNNQAYNNTLYNNTTGINVEASGGSQAKNAIVKNNISVGNTGSNYHNAGLNTVASNNKITGAITDCNVSTTDFTLKAGAACID